MHALLLLSALSVSAAEPVPLAFEDLPRLVVERNDEARGTAVLAQAAERRRGHQRRSWLPTVEGQVGGERFQTGDYRWRSEAYGSAEAALNLFRGGRDAAEETGRRGLAAAAQAHSRRSLAEELRAARESYWELVSLRELRGIVVEAAARNEQHLELAERRIKAGLATDADRLEFQINRSVLKEESESLNHEALLVQIDLAARLGSAAGTAFVTSTEVPHAHDEELFKADAVPPAVLALEAAEGVAEGQKMTASRWWAPALDLYGGYHLYTLRERDYLVQRSRDDRVAGLRLSVPLFDGLRSRAEAEAASLRQAGYALQARQARLTYAAALERAKEELRHVHELVHHGEERTEQGRRYLSVILDEYGRGIKNSVDVLSAAQRQLGFRRQSAERRREYELAKARLLQLLGR